MVPLYPLLLDPIYMEKVWGGRSFERFDRTLPGGESTLYGESWELADLAATAPSGGGGAEARSKILNGPLMKRTVRDVVEHFGALITGDVRMAPDGGFPLLLKYLDARENLSVQVHPTAEYAAAHPGASVKSEAWYVVAADPGALLYLGFRKPISAAEGIAAAADGSIVDLMKAVPARVGDCHYIPSGTCHALGGGVLVAEVQTPSDTTYRVFDWHRGDRELHLEQAFSCMDLGVLPDARLEPGAVHSEGGVQVRELVDCEHFGISEWSLEAGAARVLRFDRVKVLMFLQGRGEVEWGSEGRSLQAGAGQTVLLPAALAEATLRADGALTVLSIDFPEP